MNEQRLECGPTGLGGDRGEHLVGLIREQAETWRGMAAMANEFAYPGDRARRLHNAALLDGLASDLAATSGPPGQCLRCDASLTTAEHEKGGRWREFCHPCREILQANWPRNRP